MSTLLDAAITCIYRLCDGLRVTGFWAFALSVTFCAGAFFGARAVENTTAFVAGRWSK